MYDSSILMFLAWPAIIIISYFTVRIALTLYEKGHGKSEQEKNQETV